MSVNAPVIAAAVVGISASAAHFILPQPAKADDTDVSHRLLVGAGAIIGAGAVASLVTKDTQYAVLGVLLSALMFAGYKAAQWLDAKYV